VIGRNGVGKTTLVRSIMGLTPPRQGKVYVNGRSTSGLAPEQIARLGIGWVPQGRQVFPSLRVRENLTVAARGGRGRPWTLDSVYAMFPQLQFRADAWADQLSGGQQQMLALGRALMTNPKIVVMDEPLEGLSPSVAEEVVHMVLRLKGEGISILLVEQKADIVLAIADEVNVMSQGAMIFCGSPDELREDPQILSRYLGVT
jgi:branched-chain amino acid transport system ATP-binding protein